MTRSLRAEPRRYQSCRRQSQHSVLVCSGATSADFRGKEEWTIKVCIQKCCRVIKRSVCWPAFLKHSPRSYHPLRTLTHAASHGPGYHVPQLQSSRCAWLRGLLLLLTAEAQEESHLPKGVFGLNSLKNLFFHSSILWEIALNAALARAVVLRTGECWGEPLPTPLRGCLRGPEPAVGDLWAPPHAIPVLQEAEMTPHRLTTDEALASATEPVQNLYRSAPPRSITSSCDSLILQDG